MLLLYLFTSWEGSGKEIKGHACGSLQQMEQLQTDLSRSLLVSSLYGHFSQDNSLVSLEQMNFELCQLSL